MRISIIRSLSLGLVVALSVAFFGRQSEAKSLEFKALNVGSWFAPNQLFSAEASFYIRNVYVLNVVFSGDEFQQLAAVTNDRNASVDRLYVAVNAQGAVDGVRFLPGGSNIPADFTDAEMSSAEGANIEENSHKPIMLHSELAGQPGRINWVIDYLSNGLFGSYKSCRAAVVRDSHGQWHLLNVYNNKMVTQLRIKTWMMGITTIQGICP